MRHIEHFQRLVTHMFFPTLAVLLIAALYQHSIALALLLLAITAYLYTISRTHQKHLIIIAFVIGICFEIFFTMLGVWTYGFPDFLGITYWIPFAWSIGAWAVSGYL